jgi:hypothetical protein
VISGDYILKQDDGVILKPDPRASRLAEVIQLFPLGANRAR